MRGDAAVWITVLAVSGMWCLVAITRTIVDGIVRTKQARLEFERDHLLPMMAELQEIKAHLRAESREPAA
jgi:hypothetical protein